MKKLRDRLVSGAAKNFLGQFKGDAGVWDKLVRAYEVESRVLPRLHTMQLSDLMISLSFCYCRLPELELELDNQRDLNADIQIGEIALGLIRNGEYEIPFLQSQIAKQQQQLIDHEKREADYAKMALNAQRNHIQVGKRHECPAAHAHLPKGCETERG